MNKNSYLVISVDDGGLYAYVEKWPHNHDLIGFMRDKRYKAVNICDSKKDAVAIAAFWNECYRRNGAAPEWVYPMNREVLV